MNGDLHKPTLGPAWEMVIRERRAFVERRQDRQPVAALTPFEAVTLGLMDGRRTWAELRAVLLQAAGAKAEAAATTVAQRLRPLLADGAEPREPADLRALSSVETPAADSGLRDRPGPDVLHWWVTSYCPRTCLYCFAEPIRGGAAPDATLSLARLRELFQEARSLGTRSLLVAGAEPLLRPDLPEVLADAIDAGLDPVLTTKHLISAPLAERLARAGVVHLSISLDSTEDEVNASLVGSRSYLAQVRASIRHLRAAGVAFSLQAVASQLDPWGFESVVAFAAEEGARVIQVVPFEPVLHPIGAARNSDMLLPSDAEVRARVAELRGQHHGLEIQLFEQLGSGDRSGFQCDIGMTKLFFLADGVVHRCYKLRHDDRLRGRSLVDVGIAAAWHDPGFREIISPPGELYEGSACHGCESFSQCHADGRCIYQALVDHGRYHAPDRKCARATGRVRLPVVS